jgi:rod shape-determining protein MreD
MAFLRPAVVVLTAVVVHAAVFPQLRIAGVSADVLLLVAVAAGMAAGAERGAVVGFVAGLGADCFLQTPFGLSALVLSVVGWGVGAFHETVLHPARWVVVLVGLVASAAGVVLYALAGAALGEQHLLTARLPVIVGVVAAVNALLTPAAVAVLRWALVTRRPTRLVLQ